MNGSHDRLDHHGSMTMASKKQVVPEHLQYEQTLHFNFMHAWADQGYIYMGEVRMRPFTSLRRLGQHNRTTGRRVNCNSSRQTRFVRFISKSRNFREVSLFFFLKISKHLLKGGRSCLTTFGA